MNQIYCKKIRVSYKTATHSCSQFSLYSFIVVTDHNSSGQPLQAQITSSGQFGSP